MNRTYRYPATLRGLGMFVALLSGAVLLGSLLAEIEAADVPDLVLHAVGFIVALALVWLGVEFGLRQVTVTPDAFSTRLLRAQARPWSDIASARDGPLGTLIIRPRHGWPIILWPYLEDFGLLLAEVEERVARVPS